MTTTIQINGRKIDTSARYHSLAMARQAASHAVKMALIVLGDDGRFWVVTPADGERLVRAGYEYAN